MCGYVCVGVVVGGEWRGGEEKRREGERGICLAVPVPVPVLSLPTHTHCMHPHPHPHPHMHSFPPSFPPSFPLSLVWPRLLPPSPPLFLFLSSLTQHTHTQAHTMHGLGCTLLPPQHPTHPQGRREGGREYSTKPSSHAAQAHHTPLHAINNENKAGKRKKKKKTGVGNEEMPLGIHMLFLFIFCSFLIHILFFHPHTLFTFLPRFYPFLYSFHFSFLYPMP